MHASSVPVSNAMVLARWVRRAEVLAPAVWLAAVDRWEMTPGSERREAEVALARAVESTGRSAVRDVVVSLVHDLADSVGWFSTRARSGAPLAESSAASVAANAALAILLRDQLEPQHFERLYSPFADALPLHSLADR